VKARTSNYGENRAAKKLGIEMIPLGEGFTWLSEDIEKDKGTARECWEMAREKIASGQYDIVVLDEMTYPMSYGWIAVEEVIDTLRQRPEGLHVIITGRDAPQELIDFADLVTEMREVKHPHQKGLKAQPGIDF
jgi:cob(I)alamin adenosyltransferase